MSYSITLSTLDDQKIQFNCDAEQSVQDAAEAVGFFPPAICKMGGCGSCLAVCDSGDYQLKSYSQGMLPDNAEEMGDILLCRTYPKSDLIIHAPYNADKIQSRQPLAREAEVVKAEILAERTVRLVLQLLPDEEQGLAFEFEPGQFVELEVPSLDLKRAYSLSNTPNWDGQLEFLIRLQNSGLFSNYLKNKVKIGDAIKVHGPSGTFGIQGQSLNPRCFIAGGTGLAPFLSMLRRMAEWGEDHPTQLFLGVNNEQEVFCRQELEELQQALPQLHVNFCVWKPSEDWIDFSGTPADALAIYLKQIDILPDIYLCGPPLLVEATTQIALQNGISPERIHCERFA
ncbi:MAG: 2Fe-2S iron-sulfur cluster binding domain-containing protein [Methylococcaceae bacterium]|nr:2Fe-2S iron-sulfur cluster binding domain-containing protein [Methylococcaceae bacterium]